VHTSALKAKGKEEERKGKAHLAGETFKTPFPTKRFHSPITIPNTPLTRPTFRRPQAYMAHLAVRMAFEYREANFLAVRVHRDVERAVAFDVDALARWGYRTRTRTRRVLGGGGRGSEERVTAFGAEEVLFVVGAFAEGGVVEGDEAFVDDGRFAAVALRGEDLGRTPNSFA
jgi:hypothetical protein